MMTEHQ